MGNLPDWLGVTQARQVLDVLLRYADACGPLARVPLGPVNLLVVSGPSEAAEALSLPEANHKGLAYTLTRLVLDNVLLHNGPVWERHRDLYRRALRGVDLLGPLESLLPGYVRRWCAGGEVALEREVPSLLAELLCQSLAGVSYDPALEPARQRVQYELAGVGIDLQCQPWAYVSVSRWTALRASVRAMRGFFLAAVRARRRGGAGGQDALAGFLALAREGAYPGDDAALCDGLMNLFFTAHDVLNSALSFALYQVAAHPAEQSALAEELARTPASEHERSPRLTATVKEALRLYPGYPLFGRTTLRPIALGGYAIPRGTMLLVSPYVTHRLARYWPDPSRFDPSRFADDPSAMGSGVRGNYLPFGAGARGCLASHLAVPLMKRALATVVTRARLTVPAGHSPRVAYWGTAYSENGLPVWASAVSAP